VTNAILAVISGLENQRLVREEIRRSQSTERRTNVNNVYSLHSGQGEVALPYITPLEELAEYGCQGCRPSDR
jgi:hypothetical protein